MTSGNFRAENYNKDWTKKHHGWAQGHMKKEDKRTSELEGRKYKLANPSNGNYMKRKNEQMCRDLWEHNKGSKVCVARVPEGEDKEEGAKKCTQRNMAERSSYWKKKRSKAYIFFKKLNETQIQ